MSQETKSDDMITKRRTSYVQFTDGQYTVLSQFDIFHS